MLYSIVMSADILYRAQLEPFFPGEESKILDKLLEYAAYLYKSLYRYSGESYFHRALRLTCEKILKLNPDRDMIVASVLISAMYSPRYDGAKIEELFGKEAAGLVESLGKINSIKSRYSSSDTKIISKMFLTLAHDIRVVLIRLADRIENMETLQFKTPEKQKANAREILDVYVPIASRLGLYDFKLTLEDLAFAYVFPDEHQALKNDLDRYLSETEKNIEDIKKELQKLLVKNGFEVMISGRIKNLFSIYKKLKKKTATLDQIYDIYAMRIVLNTDENVEVDSQDNLEKLYKILSVLNAKYESLPDRFKDYIARPKNNGYRSLHTALVGLNSRDAKKPTEVQIRTASMHKFAEMGVASHWLYKEKSQGHDPRLLSVLGDLRKNLKTIDAGTAVLKMNLYSDRVFVLTPENLVKELPVGSTPIDFAYAVHSDIGHHCHLAKVNSNVVPLDYELKNGDIIEIITFPKVNTKLSWLGFAKTKHARNRIKNYFRTLDKDTLFDQGKEDLNLLLEKLKIEKLDESLTFLKTYKGRSTSAKERVEIMEELGAGTITSGIVFKNATGKSADILLRPSNKLPQQRKARLMPVKQQMPAPANKLIIGGQKDMPYRLASCCKPKITEKVIAYVTKIKGVSLHRANCKFVINADAERLLEAHLAGQENEVPVDRYHVSLVLEVTESYGQMKDIISLVNRARSTILGFNTSKLANGLTERRMLIDVLDDEQLDTIVRGLEHVNGVQKVSRL